MAKVIKAVAGILLKEQQVLMASRPIGKVHAGAWEFPGGKLESGESAINALVRELHEEIGVIVDPGDCQHFTFLTQDYSHATVDLDVILVYKWHGNPKALEEQQLHWQNLHLKCQQAPLLITTQKILDLLTKQI